MFIYPTASHSFTTISIALKKKKSIPFPLCVLPATAVYNTLSVHTWKLCVSSGAREVRSNSSESSETEENHFYIPHYYPVPTFSIFPLPVPSSFFFLSLSPAAAHMICAQRKLNRLKVCQHPGPGAHLATPLSSVQISSCWSVSFYAFPLVS